MDDGWDWGVAGEYWPLVRNGAIVSVVLTLITIALGTALGVAMGLIVTTVRGFLRPLAWIVLAWIGEGVS